LQIFDCLTALKEYEILHRDLRSVNLMMYGQAAVKLIDFDCAFIRGVSNGDSLTFAFCDSATAPEVVELVNAEEEMKGQLTAEEMYARQIGCDLYSFGTVVYEMITGE
jgi:serine/threonine protein kinase